MGYIFPQWSWISDFQYENPWEWNHALRGHDDAINRIRQTSDSRYLRKGNTVYLSERHRQIVYLQPLRSIVIACDFFANANRSLLCIVKVINRRLKVS